MENSNRPGEEPARRGERGDAVRDAGVPRLFVVSDMRLYRDFLVQRLLADERVELVGAAPVAAAAAQVVALRPDVLLLDAEAPGAQMLPHSLRAYLPGLRVVACAVQGKPQDNLAWLRAGVADCVREDCSLDEVVRAVDRAWRDEVVATAALSRFTPSDPAGAGVGGTPAAIQAGSLTQRERQVLSLVGANLPNKEIARQLGLHPSTVKNYVHRILHKLGMADRREAARQQRC